jgi:hypothetical protein
MSFGALERSSIISLCVCTLPEKTHTCCIARILEEEEEEEDLEILRQILEQVVSPIFAKNHRACEFFDCKTHLNSVSESRLYKNSVFFSPFPKSSLECKFLELSFGLVTSGLCLVLQLVAALRSQVWDLQLCELRALDCKFVKKISLDVCVLCVPFFL